MAVVETDLGDVSGVAADGIDVRRPRRRDLPARAHAAVSRRAAVAEPLAGRGSGSAFLGPNLEQSSEVGEHTFRVWSVDTSLLDAGTEGWLYVEPEQSGAAA